MNPFEAFLTDSVTLHKQDGTEVKDIKASVQNRKIFLFDVSLRIEPNDRLVRTLPSGQVEEFIVEEANYTQAFHSIPAQWTIICRRGNQTPKVRQTVTYQVNGPNARINVHSQDYSTNIFRQDSPTIFHEMERAVSAQIIGEVDRQQMLERIGELERAYGSPGFLARYQDFIASAANHMTLFAPFLPALTALLK